MTLAADVRDPDGHKRSAGSFSTRREAQRAANREEQKVLAGSWHDSSLGDITFREYVETEWLPNKHVEASTRAAYVSNLDKHFYPFFGSRRLNRISPSLVQDWVTHAHNEGLSPRSIRKHHVFLSSIFGRAVKLSRWAVRAEPEKSRDQSPLWRPCRRA